MAIAANGEEQVNEVITGALAPFEQSDGSYRMVNVFRYVIAQAP
jgi:hypothetical protein